MPLMRGLKPTPRHKLLAAAPHRVVKAPLPQFAVVPKQLSMWLNDQVGDCVTAEEAYAKACWSIQCGLSELFIPDAEVRRWATKYGFMNGAFLPDVMAEMAKDGFTVGGVNYKDGPPEGVDYSNETVLQSALCQGPVKIGIDANALPGGAGNGNGWYDVATGHYGNEDHCVGLSGYGTASYLYSMLGVPLPAALPATTPGYLLFTWSSIGFVTHGWLMGTCQEAWVRTPTTVGQSPVPPVPPVPPSPPSPPPPPVHQVVTIPDRTTSFHHWVTGTVPITIPGGTYVVTSVTSEHPSLGVNWLRILPDVRKLVTDGVAILPEVKAVFADIQSGNWTGTVQDFVKVIGDIGPVIADVEALIADFTS